MAGNIITTTAELDALYGDAHPVALMKELDHISDDYARFIEASPFVVLATSGDEGLDCSPRGDPAGFVRVLDRNTVAIPDRRGNNRVDSLRNIVRDPRVALLFLIPGIGETMRINGRARLSTDPALCESFVMEGKVPKCVILVTAERVYPQCQKALVRSKLWDPASRLDRSALPTVGQMMQGIAERKKQEPFDGAAYDAAYPARLRDTIY
ncbi:MAG TPA: pyridoxamine 5'-phosphate oxidase family protein [Hyphomicrobiaceae bacterium]|nr:pyridoxamine 5'-phosphate oxidase family protein [Hyphomicrobiaceae bacterium]